jgi:hypothetical protein
LTGALTWEERLGRRKPDGAKLPKENLSQRLGVLIATLPAKPTFFVESGLQERVRQLFTEVRDVCPVVNEPAGRKDQYKDERLFISVSQDVSYLAEAGHPLIEAPRADEETFVEAARIAKENGGTRARTSIEEVAGEPVLDSLYTSTEHAAILKKAAGVLGKAGQTPAAWIAAHIALADQGDCIVFHDQADVASELAEIQALLRNTTGLATSRAVDFEIAPENSYVIQLTAGENARSLKVSQRPSLRVHLTDESLEPLRAAVQLLSMK